MDRFSFRFLSIAVGAVFLFLDPAAGQDVPESAPAESALDPELASPRATLTTFLKGIEAAQGSDDEKQWAKVYKTLDIAENVGDARQDAALRLLQILKALGEIDPEKVAPDAEQAAEDRLERFELFPGNPYTTETPLFEEVINEIGDPPGKIVLARDEEMGWRFNGETVAAITILFGWIEERLDAPGVEETERPFMDSIRQLMPEWMQKSIFLGMELWQWLAVCLSLLLTVAVYAGLTMLLAPGFAAVDHWLGGKPDARMMRKATRPAALAIAALAFMLFLKPLGIIGTALSTFLLAARLVLVFSITWGAWALSSLLTDVWARRADETESTFDDMLVPLVRKTVHLIIIIWAIFYLAASIDVLNFVTPILAGFGLAGLAVSFAAQDLIRNLFGGLTIFLDRPFQLEEQIIFEGYEGIVEEIGFRSTRIRTTDGHLVTVPNGAITNNCVENIGRRPAVRREIKFSISYQTPPEKIRTALDTIRKIFEEDDFRESVHPVVDGVESPPRVFFEELAESSLDIRVIYWSGESGAWEDIELKEKINFRLLEEIEKLDIEFA